MVDDDDSILRMIRLALEAAGFEVESASSPIGVGALVRRVAPHVVVLDVSMPGLDGEGVAGGFVWRGRRGDGDDVWACAKACADACTARCEDLQETVEPA